MLSGELAVLQEPMLDGFPFDPFSLFADGCGQSCQSNVAVGVWANNLLDKKYAIYKNQTLDNFGLARTDFGETCSYGVELTLRF